MAGEKVTVQVTLTEPQLAWLTQQAERYNLPDREKALRCVLDFAMTDADPTTVFGVTRCPHCEPGKPCSHAFDR